MNALHGCGVPIKKKKITNNIQYNESHEKLNNNEVESNLLIVTISFGFLADFKEILHNFKYHQK